jgi:hypothetical protein
LSPPRKLLNISLTFTAVKVIIYNKKEFMSAQEVVTHNPGENKEIPRVSEEEQELVFRMAQIYGRAVLKDAVLDENLRAFSRSEQRENLELLAKKDAEDKYDNFRLFREGGKPAFNVTYVPEEPSNKLQHEAFTQVFGLEAYNPWDDPHFETEQVILTYDDAALYRKCYPDYLGNPHTIQYYARLHGDTDTTRPEPVFEQ